MEPTPTRSGRWRCYALEEIHCAIYGRAPEAARAWTEGDAILLLMRIRPSTQAIPTPVDEIQRMVAVAVHRRTGVTLRPGGVNVDPGRGLAVLAFERVDPAVQSDETRRGRPGGGRWLSRPPPRRAFRSSASRSR